MEDKTLQIDEKVRKLLKNFVHLKSPVFKKILTEKDKLSEKDLDRLIEEIKHEQ